MPLNDRIRETDHTSLVAGEMVQKVQKTQKKC